ncbi:MAG TPA: hypothetical protein DCM62_07665 [Bacteroidales bacterium]|nr:hypothetical protein [Bacteroidales bacterium]
MFKKDSYHLGVLLGLFILATLYFVVIGILYFLGKTEGIIFVQNPQAPALAGLAANLLLFRYFMINLKAYKTGKALLATTFVFTIVAFVIL